MPELPELIVNHESLLAAVHGHPAPTVTATEPTVPAAGADILAGAIPYVQLKVTDRVTGTVIAMLPACDVRTIWAVYVPAGSVAPATTVAVTALGVV